MNSWFTSMPLGEPVEITASGRDLLIHLLSACIAYPELAAAGCLGHLCSVHWNASDLLTKHWIGVLLIAIATRPAGEAFACAERLANNPSTSALPGGTDGATT